MHAITAGFLPLLDSAVLVATKEAGFAAAEHIDLTLVRETSWANIRDRLAVGHFNAAHMLGPMPIACNFGLAPLRCETIVPMALGLGGNAITVSQAVWRHMQEFDAGPGIAPKQAGTALRSVVGARAGRGLPALRLAVVHPHSGHNYELRYWLAACGIRPDIDVEIVIVPPPLMADSLRSGTIDGYCVGEPWNTAATSAGLGRIVTVKSAIWRSSPEKVLAVDSGWAQRNRELLGALLRAAYRGARWCGDRANHGDLADMLAADAYIGKPAEWMLPALSGQIQLGDGTECQIEDFFAPFAKAATFPWQSHAAWFYAQMVRWGQVAHSADNVRIAMQTYRPDLYRGALKTLGAPLPGANAKVEGALDVATPVGAAGGDLVLGPDGFFDGAIFDPSEIDTYIRTQAAMQV